MTQKEQAKLEGLVAGQTVAVLAAFGEDGRPVAQAVAAPRVHSALKEMLFMLPAGDAAAELYGKNPKAEVYFYARGQKRGVLLKGEAAVKTDTASKEKVWRDEDGDDYPKGAADPGFCVLRFAAKTARLFSKDAGGKEYVI